MSGESNPAGRTTPDPPDGIAVEPAAPDDRLDVLRIVDAAMLEVDADPLADRIAADDVRVARAERTGAVVGAVVVRRPEPTRRHVEAVAVRRERRGRGIGSALVAAAVRRAEDDGEIDVVTAAFVPRLDGFYTELGFAIDADADSEAVGDTTEGDADRGAAADAERLFGRYRV